MKKELPERAISWVVSLLRSLNIVITPEKEDLVRSSHLGVGALTVHELRIVGRHIENLLHAKNENEQYSIIQARFEIPKSRAAKPAWITCIKKCFHKDDRCKEVVDDDDAIWSLIDGSIPIIKEEGNNSGGIVSSSVSSSPVKQSAKEEVKVEVVSSGSSAAGSLAVKPVIPKLPKRNKKRGGGQRRAPTSGPTFSLG
uniref:Uncharacterized protein n=1 Tax=Ditylum brightwellii TaxID=49249 RepID=A0A7S2EGZ7_9STRA|mmetsp:Transcript_29880/g.44439  ORF Transcript_29880/g.44439 Transcript_29880/m.44439 type:complete len:198 (+) Transcript_29880:371-964(+)